MGNLIPRVATHAAFDLLWGLAMARADFGRFSGATARRNFGTVDQRLPAPVGCGIAMELRMANEKA